MGAKEKVRVRGYDIAFYRKGSGETALLIHGITTYSFIWRKQLPALERQFDTIAIDLLGCGDSDKPTNVDYSVKAQAELIKDFIKTLGIKRVHLICHDIGGAIGQIMAVRYPETLKTLTLINTVGYDYWPVQPIVSLRVPFLRELALAAMDAGFYRAIIRRAIYHKDRLTDELMEYFYRPLKSKEGRQGFLHLAKCLNNRDLMDIADKLGSIKIPVLIIRGENDPYLSPRISERLHEDIHSSMLKRVQKAGHFIQEDMGEELADMIIDFIKGSRKDEGD